MAITGKQYVDLKGLTEFKRLLVAGYANGDFSVLNATNATNAEIATNYKTADGKSASIKDALASKADETKLTEEVGKLVPKTTTIAGVDLQDNITASELISVLDASSKIVNVIEEVHLKGSKETSFTKIDPVNKVINIDLSEYAKTSDITAVLKFKGVKGTFAELEAVENPSVGDVWIVTEGSEYAEYVYVDTNGSGYKWEKLGVGVDLRGYYTKGETDSAISTAVGNAKTEITGAYQEADTALKGEIQGNIDALYKVDGENATGVIATRISAVETKANNNETAINTLNGADTVEGSVAKKIKDAIGDLDSTSSDGTANGGYILSVTQTDGKVAVEKAEFAGDVATAGNNAVTGSAVSTYVTTQIGNLDVTDIGEAGKFISVVGETDGKIHATPTAFANSVKATTTDADNIASNEYAVRTAIDSAYEMITSIPLTGDSGSIASIFANLVSKTRDLITGTIEVAESDTVTSIADYAFTGCSSLTEVSFPVATSIGEGAFSSCSNLTSVFFPLATSIGFGAFTSCSSLTSVSFPNAISIGDYAFYQCNKLTSVSFPLATSIGDSAFDSCSSLTTIYVGTESDTVCTLFDTTAFNNCNNLTNIYVPASLVDSYKSDTNWSSYADKIKAYIQPVECIALSITADNVAIGNATSTTVYYTAKCTYTKGGILQEGTRVFTGKATSDSFEQNTSTTNTVQREVSFTFLGQTATTTITQGVWIDKAIFVTTEGISDYGWVTADDTYNVDEYDVYMSNNKGVNNSNAVMKLECIGYKELTIYIRSNAESKYDYTIASIANASAYPTSSSSSDTKAHTSGNQKAGTSLSDYTAVTYTGLSGNDTIYIVFTKDSGDASGDDRGYVLIPKQA